MKEDRYISLRKASTITPYSQEYLSLLARRGKISATKVGRVWHVEKGEILEYYATHKENIVRFGNASRKARSKTRTTPRIGERSRYLSDFSKKISNPEGSALRDV